MAKDICSEAAIQILWGSEVVDNEVYLYTQKLH